MATISKVMSHSHKQCDEYYAATEGAVADADWARAEEAWDGFSAIMEKHITAIEEDMLFPEIEKVIGPVGPTQVMRSEHEQMRGMMAQMSAALSGHDAQTFLGLSETLMILMQQHNMKEEQVLYPMMDQMLANAADIAARLESA